MEKEFVPYELAVKLKALGFDEPTICVYNSYKHLKGVIISSMDGDYIKKEKWEDRLPAPTFSQAFRWFREKYGVHSSPRKFDEGKWWVEWGTWTSPIFETFEEVEISWLTKLIEIVEPKSE